MGGMSLITPAYMEAQRALHAQGNYGISSGRWADIIREITETEKLKSVLDYGCGQGQLRAKLGDIVSEYDPCIAGKDSDPKPADLVCCMDVLEHIEPECLEDVLHHLRSKVRKRLFFTISLSKASKNLPDGRNAHLNIETVEWWIERLAPYFRVVQYETIECREMVGVASPVAMIAPIKSVGAISNDDRNRNTALNVGKTDKRIPDGPAAAHDGTVVLACYGPSLRETWRQIAGEKRKHGAIVVSVSGAHDYLRTNGLIPAYHVECDPRPHKGDMLLRPHDKTKYLMASCCDPALISRMASYDLTLWHLYNGAGSFAIRDIPSEKWAAMIPGGGSVGLRCLPLFYFLGYRKFIIHGMDCSFDDGQHAGPHAGKVQQEVNVRPSVKMPDGVLWSERWFKTSPVLISYANHLMKDLREGRFGNATLELRGNGLLREMMRLEAIQAEAFGIQPGPRRDYFTLEEGDIRPDEKENAA